MLAVQIEKDKRALALLGLHVDERLMPLQIVHDTADWKGVTILVDESAARLAVKEGLFGNWKWIANKSGSPGNRVLFCNDHISCEVRLRLKRGKTGCEISLNVAKAHALEPNAKKRKNSAMTFEQEKLSMAAISMSMHMHISLRIMIYPIISSYIKLHHKHIINISPNIMIYQSVSVYIKPYHRRIMNTDI